MKYFSQIIWLLILCSFSLTLSAQTVFVAHLTGRNEVPPVRTMAGGEITLEVKNGQVIVTGNFSNLSSDLVSDPAGRAHLHLGYAGQNGGVIVPLTVTADGDLRGGALMANNNTFALTSEINDAIEKRQIYVNIHTTDHPGGEIRGQFLRADANSYYMANLFGSNEVPSVVSRGHGALAIEIKGTRISITGSFDDLEGEFDPTQAGGAHLHLANAGGNGTIHFPLVASVDADGKGGVFTAFNNTLIVDGALLTPFSTRNLYANIHSTKYPSGELRGQVTGYSAIAFRAHLSGSNEVPVLNVIGTGRVLAEIFSDSTLLVSGAFNRLTSPLVVDPSIAVHIHEGLAGDNGPVLRTLSVIPTGDLLGGTVQAVDNRITLNGDEVDAFLRRAAYINVHTVANTSGELRGQLLPESNAFFHGFVSGISSAPAFASTGTGLIVAEWLGEQLTLSGSFANLESQVDTDIAGGIHIHNAPLGSNGPLLQPLNLELNDDQLSGVLQAENNEYTLDSAMVVELMNRAMYVNIHTDEDPAGEVRAQLLHEATSYFIATMSGASESPPVQTDAFGAVAAEVSADRVTLTGSFSGLKSNYATNIGSHIHFGLAGQNSNVIYALQPSLSDDLRSGIYLPDSNRFTYTFVQLQDLLGRKNYVNVHSADFPGGEIRGQLLPLATSYFSATLLARNEPDPITSEGRGDVKLELTGNKLVASGIFRSLEGELDLDLMNGTHIHFGLPGLSGDVEIPLVPTQTNNLLGGIFAPIDNTFELTDAQVAQLRDGEYYINVHTNLAPQGEIRGQILPEINFYPTRPQINFPPEGEVVGLEGDPATPFVASWSRSVDNNYVIYTWQLSANANFSTMLVSQGVGTDTSFVADFGTLDALLESAGVAVGDTITLYHRAVATDGSLTTTGTASVVLVERLVVTNTRSLLPIRQWGLRLWPNIVNAQSQLTADILAAKATAAELVIFTAVGQIVHRERLSLFVGDNQHVLTLPDLSGGTYFVNLVVDGQLLPAQRIVIKP